jgi:hypothetical protein
MMNTERLKDSTFLTKFAAANLQQDFQQVADLQQNAYMATTWILQFVFLVKEIEDEFSFCI